MKKANRPPTPHGRLTKNSRSMRRSVSCFAFCDERSDSRGRLPRRMRETTTPRGLYALRGKSENVDSSDQSADGEQTTYAFANGDNAVDFSTWSSPSDKAGEKYYLPVDGED